MQYYRNIPWSIYSAIVTASSTKPLQYKKKKLKICKRALLKGTMGGWAKWWAATHRKWKMAFCVPGAYERWCLSPAQAGGHIKPGTCKTRGGGMNMRTKAELLSPRAWGRELKSPHPASYIICMVHNLQGSAMQISHNVDTGDFRVAVRTEFIYALPANAGQGPKSISFRWHFQ